MSRTRHRITDAALGIAERDVDEIMIVIDEEVAPLLRHILHRDKVVSKALFTLAADLARSIGWDYSP